MKILFLFIFPALLPIAFLGFGPLLHHLRRKKYCGNDEVSRVNYCRNKGIMYEYEMLLLYSILLVFIEALLSFIFERTFDVIYPFIFVAWIFFGTKMFVKLQEKRVFNVLKKHYNNVVKNKVKYKLTLRPIVNVKEGSRYNDYYSFYVEDYKCNVSCYTVEGAHRWMRVRGGYTVSDSVTEFPMRFLQYAFVPEKRIIKYSFDIFNGDYIPSRFDDEFLINRIKEKISKSKVEVDFYSEDNKIVICKEAPVRNYKGIDIERDVADVEFFYKEVAEKIKTFYEGNV